MAPAPALEDLAWALWTQSLPESRLAILSIQGQPTMTIVICAEAGKTSQTAGPTWLVVPFYLQDASRLPIYIYHDLLI